MFSLVLRSRKPEAKRFRRWVTSEVLPTIRKSGTYAAEHTPKSAEASQQLAAHEQRTALAFAMATQISAEVQRSVFEALIAGGETDDWRFGRWMFLFGDDPMHPDHPGRPLVRAIDPRAFVMTLERLTEGLRNGDASASDKDLADLAAACVQRLAQRLAVKPGKPV